MNRFVPSFLCITALCLCLLGISCKAGSGKPAGAAPAPDSAAASPAAAHSQPAASPSPAAAHSQPAGVSSKPAPAHSLPAAIAAAPVREAGYIDPDKGAAAYAQTNWQEQGLIPAAYHADYPLAQRSRIVAQGGGVRGWGMLARYGEGGPRRLLVSRLSRRAENEPFAPIALARVFDPQGNLVAVAEFTDQEDGVQVRSFDIGSGPAGIWRVSFSGGRQGDLVEMRLPATDIWGVRGEMALAVSSTTPQPAYLWVPPTSGRLIIGIEQGNPAGFEVRSGGARTLLGTPQKDTTGRPASVLLSSPPAGEIIQLSWNDSFNGSLVVDGAPGLLCPSAEAARDLQGGAVMSHGVWTAGPLQARARDWMVRNIPTADAPRLAFPKAPEPDAQALQHDVLGFSRSGPLNHLQAMFTGQDLDPSGQLFGAYAETVKRHTSELHWQHFWPARNAEVFAPSALAAAITFNSPYNPVYQNPELITRATLAAFGNIQSLQGDDLLREGSMDKTRYPITHVFFSYPSALADPYELLHNLLPADAREIWKQAAMAVGDKLADYQAYQSNQWSHVMRGHLSVYMATGEKRFLGYFERQMHAYLDNTFGPASKFGQHPAGYYLEDGGPDGNYDKLNAFCVVSSYYDYRDLPDADPALVAKMHRGIEQNLRFKSYFWLPQPDGRILSPTAINARTTGMLGGSGYPGDFMAKGAFPLGTTRYLLTKPVGTGAGIGMQYSFLANTEAWQRQVLQASLTMGPARFNEPAGTWLPFLAKAYALPQAAPAPLPALETSGRWQMPGLLAWKQGDLYGVSFYAVTGGLQRVGSILGGAPSALWTEGTGNFLMSMQPKRPAQSFNITDTAELTFACLYGKDAAGKFFYSGKEHGTLEENNSPDSYTIRSHVSKAALDLLWSYRISPDATEITIEAHPQRKPQELYLNLPLVNRLAGTQIRLTAPGKLLYQTPQGSVCIEWTPAVEAKLEPSSLKETTRLIIPMPADSNGASSLTLRITSGGKS